MSRPGSLSSRSASRWSTSRLGGLPGCVVGPVGDDAVDTAGTDTPWLTLCFRCGVVLQLTPDQVIVQQAEEIALGTIHPAFCRRCREAPRR
jgi:hypothetical protein